MVEPTPAPSDPFPATPLVSPGVLTIKELNRRALEDPEGFWGPIAAELSWFDRRGPLFHATADPPYGSWFSDWSTNLAFNCLDRWIDSPRRHQVAFYWEGEPGDHRVLTYYQLYREVNRLAAAMKTAGVGQDDRVTLYLPMVPELPIAMLATARLGAIHSVVFGGFAAPALAERLNDSGSRLVITADGGWRRGKVVPLKPVVDAALHHSPSVEKVLVVRRTGSEVAMDPHRDEWYHDAIAGHAGTVAAAPVRGPHPSFILYTSGTTGRPKGAVHGTGGYMLWSYYTTRVVFDVSDRDLFWCTADIGWVTGHTYVVYGPLLAGLSSVIYEGAPDFPQPDRWWNIIQKYGVTTLYTSPTAIRAAIKNGDRWPRQHDLSSLRLLGTVGEPINPEVWNWYRREIGGTRCPVVDTWWQTETGGILISPQPGTATIPLKPGSATLPVPGVDAQVVDEEGRPLPPGRKGLIVIRRPWPGQFTTLWNDDARYRSVYFSRFPKWYYPADYAMADADGYFWLLGRADEVLKVAGHRIATIELENILITHPAVAESAVIGRHDEVKGEVPVACVVVKPGFGASSQLRQELLDLVRATMGAIAVPAAIYFVDKVPKTRSAKIMRRLIRDVVEERPLGDITTLEDETSIEDARRAYQEFKEELGRTSR
ncbi:MAG: acetate--CoA ligase [Thermoplasmata archaeon]|nr:acetate--CoA ligase [Thermoplasmata archaeon]